MQLAERNIDGMMNLNFFQWMWDLKAKFHFVRFIKNPTDTVSIFKMARSFQSAAPPEVVNHVLQPLLNETHLLEDYKSKVWFSHPRMSELMNYPDGSFGKEAALFFAKNNLDEDLFPKPDFSNIARYITSRVYQTHDFWHVLTGYSVGLEDELALQAFSIGQYKQPTSLTIIAGGIIHILQNQPDRAASIMNAITEGYDRGLKSKLLLDINIFDYLDKPLDEVRRELQIAPRSQ